MKKSKKWLSKAHIHSKFKKGETIHLNMHPTIISLKMFGKSLARNDKDMFWKEHGEDMIRDSYLLHYLVCKNKLVDDVSFDIKKYNKWCREQKKIRARK